MRTRPIAAALLVVWLTACQQAPVRDENSPRSRIVPGSTVVLNKPLTVPAGHARVFLQDGEVREKVRLKRYYPHCNFEIRSVSDGTLRIEPGRFLVTGISTDEVELVRRRGALQYASLRLSDGGEMIPQVARLIHHQLHAEGRPEVMRLTCHGGFSDPWRVEYPSVADIRQDLGEWVTLEPAEP